MLAARAALLLVASRGRGRVLNPLSTRRIAIAAALTALCACGSSEPAALRSGSPADALPDHITRLLERGLRPDWSGDGRRLLFLDDLVGDVFEVDVASREVRPLTSHFEHHGFTRARYLASGDILLCGPRQPEASDAERRSDEQAAGGRAQRGGAERSSDEQSRWNTEMWLLDAGLTSPARPLGEACFEGPAVSRRSLRIAWTHSEYPERVVLGRSEIWTGEIAVEGGDPRIVDRRKLLDRSDFYYLAFLETQDFRPPDERELLFTAYAYKGGEVMGVDLETGEIHNYSRNWGYDEAEGVFPDGRAAAVEREPDTWTLVPSGQIDVWRTALDGSGRSERLTYFTDYQGFGANNPVVSPDGRWMAFGLREVGGPHGNGHGIFLYDLGLVTDTADTHSR